MCGRAPTRADDGATCTKDGSQPQYGQCTASPKDCADAKQEASTGCASACDDEFKQFLISMVCDGPVDKPDPSGGIKYVYYYLLFVRGLTHNTWY